MARSLVSKLKELGIIQIGSFVLKSGKTSNLYIDMRKAYGYPEIIDEIGDLLLAEVPHDVTCIACSGLGGIPLGSILSQKTGLKLTLVRDQAKSHGTKSAVEGYMPNEQDKVLVVDDIFSSGTSVSQTIENLGNTGFTIYSILVVLKRGKNVLPYTLDFLFTEEDLI